MDVQNAVESLADTVMEVIVEGITDALREAGITAAEFQKALAKAGETVKDVGTESTSLRARLHGFVPNILSINYRIVPGKHCITVYDGQGINTM